MIKKQGKDYSLYIIVFYINTNTAEVNFTVKSYNFAGQAVLLYDANSSQLHIYAAIEIKVVSTLLLVFSSHAVLPLRLRKL